jgi:hypothetical protein
LKSAIYNAATSGATQVIAAGNGIYVCGFALWSAGTTSVKLVYGTGTNCGTGTVILTPAFQLATSTGINDTSPFFRGLSVPPGNALCLNSSAAIAVQAVVYYYQ